MEDREGARSCVTLRRGTSTARPERSEGGQQVVFQDALF